MMRNFLFKKNLLLLFAFCILKSDLGAEYHPVPVERGGTLRGVVKFASETPPRGMFATRGDPGCPAGIPQEHLIVKQETRGIKNALVVLDVARGKPMQLTPGKLDNKGCRFEPRVQWVPRTAGVLLINSDATAHNVHAYRDDVTAFSVDLPAGGPPVRRPLVTAGLYKINCDRHLWMRAWIYVSDHPYVAVTDAQGRFELADVPAGVYTLRVWHEGWEEKGTDPSGQLRFQPVEQTMRVQIRREEVTDVLLDALQPAFLYPK
jgi:plastocyanin